MQYQYGGGYSFQQQAMNVPNAKYKTMLCRHYEATKQCSVGDKCQFAHGMSELRSMNDPLPAQALAAFQQSQQVKQSSQPTPQIKCTEFDFQSKLAANIYCKYYNNGYCRNGVSCSFIHDDSQVKGANNQVQNVQGNSMDDESVKILLAIIVNMQQVFFNNYDVYNQLKQAETQVKMGNTMWGSQVIKSIIHSEQRTPEEKEAYQKIYANVTSSYYDTSQY